MKTRIYLTIIILFFFSGIFATAIHKWEVYQLSFQAKEDYTNPYLLIPVSGGDHLLKVCFKGSAGEAKGQELILTGCWNGANKWIVNFAAPYSGKWEYTSMSGDKGLNGKKGKLEVIDWSENELQANPTRRGFIQAHSTGTTRDHYFKYADGTPFLWIGDTWWAWTNENIHFETFQKLVDNRAEKGFNVGQLYVPGNGGKGISLIDNTYTILDPEHVEKVEQMIQYANSKGITVWIHAWWGAKDINKEIGEEKMKRWWSYLVHRFAAYNVVWTLAGEYNLYNYGGFSLDFWKDLGLYVKNEDPYLRIMSLHPTPPFWTGGSDAPQWSTGDVLHEEKWLDYNQSQVGHGRYANEMVPFVISTNYARKPAKPIVITEPWYEFVEGNPTELDIRFAAWSAILSGAAGHTYGGGHVWWGFTPETGVPKESYWPIESAFERTTYDYKGAISMGVLASFFRQIEWWNLEPHPELLQESSQPFCLAKPGEEYVIYLRYGGFMTLNLNASSNIRFNYYFYNPATGIKTNPEEIIGNRFIHLFCPDSYPESTKVQDWVVHIKKID